MHQHAVAQADEINQGRFRATGTPSVTGSTPIPQYPQASGPWQGPDLVGPEPPLGYAIDQMPTDEPSTGFPASTVEDPGAPVSEAPSSDDPQPLADDVETGTGAPPLSRDQTNE
jgi:hypothetical protein